MQGYEGYPPSARSDPYESKAARVWAPSAAQRAILMRMKAGDTVAAVGEQHRFMDASTNPPTSREPWDRINERTWQFLVAAGWVDDLKLTVEGCAALAYANGDNLIPMRCGECERNVSIDRDLYRECRGAGCGIVCPDCTPYVFTGRPSPFKVAAPA